MKPDEIEKVLQILDFALKHPISSIFRDGAREEEKYSLVRVREKIENNYYSTPKQAFDQIYETIDLNIEVENFLLGLGNEVKHLLKKRTDILFASPRDWGLRVTKFRSRLAYLTANPPLSVKNLCQWPSTSYIQKPQIDFDSASELKNLAEKLNKIQNNDENNEYLHIFRQIIDENEPELKEKKEINVAELKHSTLLELKNYLQ